MICIKFHSHIIQVFDIFFLMLIIYHLMHGFNLTYFYIITFNCCINIFTLISFWDRNCYSDNNINFNPILIISSYLAMNKNILVRIKAL